MLEINVTKRKIKIDRYVQQSSMKVLLWDCYLEKLWLVLDLACQDMT